MSARCLLPAVLLLTAVIAFTHALTVDKGEQNLPLGPIAYFKIPSGQCTGAVDFARFFICPKRFGRAQVTVDEPDVNIYINDPLSSAAVTRNPPCLGDVVGTLRVACTQFAQPEAVAAEPTPKPMLVPAL